MKQYIYLIIATFFFSVVNAQESYTWIVPTGSNSENWNNESNWSPTGVPGEGDTILLNSLDNRGRLNFAENRTVENINASIFSSGAMWLITQGGDANNFLTLTVNGAINQEGSTNSNTNIFRGAGQSQLNLVANEVNVVSGNLWLGQAHIPATGPRLNSLSISSAEISTNGNLYIYSSERSTTNIGAVTNNGGLFISQGGFPAGSGVRGAVATSLTGSGLIAVTGVDTGEDPVTPATLEINGGGSSTFSGTLQDGVNARMSLLMSGSGTQTFSGLNNHSGNTTIQNGSLVFAEESELRFYLQNGGATNQILGTANATFEGLLRIDAAALTDQEGVWNLIDVNSLNVSFNQSSFGLAFVSGEEFMDMGDGLYVRDNWTFNANTGSLTVIPEPLATSSLLGVTAGILILFRRLRFKS